MDLLEVALGLASSCCSKEQYMSPASQGDVLPVWLASFQAASRFFKGDKELWHFARRMCVCPCLQHLPGSGTGIYLSSMDRKGSWFI